LVLRVRHHDLARVKLPTKLMRQCGKCGEMTAVMIDPGAATPPFQCKRCDK
ncbi:MAG: hypothetical protein QOG38_2694, partial [Hyphomicrobiales bacterium]|nr:hypothetical protein [Hyphomicrobiales bacterium]